MPRCVPVATYRVQVLGAKEIMLPDMSALVCYPLFSSQAVMATTVNVI